MQRKEEADWVFFNVIIKGVAVDAVAIRNGKIIAMDTIPYIFSNYKGYQDFNAQGFAIGYPDDRRLEIGGLVDNLAVYADEYNENQIVWKMKGNELIRKNEALLDPNWDNH